MDSRSPGNGVAIPAVNPSDQEPSRPGLQSSQRKARRYGFACLRCKARKVRCSGDRPVCRSCQQSHQDCCWGSQSSAEAQLRLANARIRELQASIVSDTSLSGGGTTPDPGIAADQPATPNRSDNDSNHGHTTSSPSPSPNVSSSNAESMIWYQVGIGEDGNLTYNGPTSRFHAGALGTRSLVNDDEAIVHQKESLRSQYSLIESVWRPLIAAKPFIGETGVSSTVGLALLDIYWTWLHPLHNCVYRPVLIMDLALGGPYCSNFLLMCIFGLAARHLPDQSQGPLGVTNAHQFVLQAKQLLLEEMSSSIPSIPTIQGLLILSGVHCAMGKSSEGWLYTGMAFRMMADVGLHLPLNKLAALESRTPAEWETRRRLYNSAYIWDKTLSLALGRPPSLTTPPYPAEDILDKYDDEIVWKPLHALEVLETLSPFRFFNTSVFCAFASLHEVTTDMLLFLAKPGSQDNLAAQISDLDKRFHKWYTGLPGELRLDDPTGTIQSPPPHIVSLNLLYHTLQILLRRSYIGFSDETLRHRMLSSCVKHSTAIHAIQELYSMTFPHRLMTYQVSYCIFIAAIVEVTELSTGPTAQRRENAAKRLGAALSVLQAEASHTPGCGRSLNTIRRLLAAEQPRKSLPSQVHREFSTGIDNWNDRVGASPRGTSIGPSAREQGVGNDIGCLSLTAADEDEFMDGTILGTQDDFRIGWPDTSIGFHPEAFPWTSLGLN